MTAVVGNRYTLIRWSGKLLLVATFLCADFFPARAARYGDEPGELLQEPPATIQTDDAVDASLAEEGRTVGCDAEPGMLSQEPVAEGRTDEGVDASLTEEGRTVGCDAEPGMLSQEPVAEGRTDEDVDASLAEEKQATDLIESMPCFDEGSLWAFGRWVHLQVRYPVEAVQKGVQGRVLCTFVIEQDGALSSVRILDSPHPLLSDEVLRVLATSPRWTPAQQDGKAVRAEFILPVQFTL